MAYVRWSGPTGPHPYESDVYIFESTRGGYECCGCSLVDSEVGHSFITPSVIYMVAHVHQHRQAGHVVPEWLEPTLLGEQAKRMDSTINQLVAMAIGDAQTVAEVGGKIATWDKDVPEAYRISPDDILEMIAELAKEGESGEV